MKKCFTERSPKVSIDWFSPVAGLGLNHNKQNMPVNKVKAIKNHGTPFEKDPLLKLRFDLTNEMIQLPHRLQSPLRNILVTLNSNHRERNNRTSMSKATQPPEHQGLLGKMLLQMGGKKSHKSKEGAEQSNRKSIRRFNRQQISRTNQGRKKKIELLGSREDSLYDRSLKKGKSLNMKHELQDQCSRMVCRKVMVSKEGSMRQSKSEWLESKARQIEEQRAKEKEETQALIIELKDMVKIKGRQTFFKELKDSASQLPKDDKLYSTSFSSHTEGIDFRTYSRPSKNRSLYKLKVAPETPVILSNLSPKYCETSKTKQELIPWSDELHRYKTDLTDMSAQQIEEWMSLTFSSILK